MVELKPICNNKEVELQSKQNTEIQIHRKSRKKCELIVFTVRRTEVTFRKLLWNTPRSRSALNLNADVLFQNCASPATIFSRVWSTCRTVIPWFLSQLLALANRSALIERNRRVWREERVHTHTHTHTHTYEFIRDEKVWQPV